METRHVYRVSPWRSRALYAVCAVFTIPLAVGGLVSGESALLTTAVLASAIMIPIIVWALRMARLTLTPEAVELRQAGATLRSSWANVQEIRLVRGAEGFVLREPMESRGAERYATTSQVVIRGAQMYDADRRQLLAEKRFIPIETFAYWLRHGDLKEVLARYVPELVRNGETEAAVTVARPPQRLSNGWILGLSAIILVSIGSVMLMATRSRAALVVLNILLVLVAVALAAMAVQNAVSSFSLFRNRRLGSGLLWGSVAVMQVLLVLSLLSGMSW